MLAFHVLATQADVDNLQLFTFLGDLVGAGTGVLTVSVVSLALLGQLRNQVLIFTTLGVPCLTIASMTVAIGVRFLNGQAGSPTAIALLGAGAAFSLWLVAAVGWILSVARVITRQGVSS